jgi:zinc protease
MAQILTVRRLRGPALLLLLLLLAVPASAQAAAEPLREQLLNGLRILIWPHPGSQELTIKLRLHSGAAFDLAGKAGGMSLLGDILFPDPATLEFFTDEMGGKLDVDTDLDSITITMRGRASEFERIVEILRNALVTTQFTPEIVTRQRDRRIKIVRETAVSPAAVADRAIATRLFGDYPYGRPASGTVEDLARIERGDLMLARERFLNPNNATLAIVGGVEKTRAMRGLRQLLGSWRKSEQIVPATFRRAEAPDTRTLIINGPADQTADVRLSVRGLARADADYNAATLLSVVARQRWLNLSPELAVKPFFVRHDGHVLPGMFVLGAAINSKSAAEIIATGKKVLDSLPKIQVTPAELEQARSELIAQMNSRLANPETMVDGWLDIDTFHLPPIAEQIQSLRTISAADLQRVANRLFHEAPIASIVLGDTQQLKAALDGRIQIEVMGEIPKPNPGQPETKPAIKPKNASKP